ncbi:MAG: type II toxin-antitoxin system VapC family toxin [Limisphaerales bacterium]
MAEYFDSTIAVSAIFPGSANYTDASARLKAAGEAAYIINHGVAEVYRTLTGRLKLPPKAAAELVEGVLLAKFKEAGLSRQDYAEVVKSMADKDLSGPIIYDALHAAGARKIGAEVLHSYNRDHFSKVGPDLTLA